MGQDEAKANRTIVRVKAALDSHGWQDRIAIICAVLEAELMKLPASARVGMATGIAAKLIADLEMATDG